MSLLVEWVRWLNHKSPFDQFKPSLAKRASRLLDRNAGLKLYGGIQGSLQMWLDLKIDYERSIYLNARDCTLIGALRRILRPGDVFVDCGANLGLLSMVAAQRVSQGGKVYAFEPSPSIHGRLKENLRLNGLDAAQTYQKGCWHERSTCKLYHYGDGSHDTATMGSADGKSVAEEMTIETVPLDDVVSSPARLVKVDIEGAEWFALQGAQRLLFEGPAPHLIIEVNAAAASPFDYHPVEMVRWILERRPGYRLHMIRSKSCRHTSVDEIAKFLEAHPQRAPNIWFEPIADA